MYSGAGMLVMAIEVIDQIIEVFEVQISGYELRDFDIKIALVIPEILEGVEV